MIWFRHYVGMVRDPKLVSIAVKTGQPIERVAWVWSAILESACEKGDGASLLDPCGAAYFLHCEPTEIEAILDAMRAKPLEMLKGQKIVAWDRRQYKSDVSTERVKRHRKRKATVTETPVKRFSNVPETPSETETEINLEKKTSSSRENQIPQVETCQRGANGNSQRIVAPPAEALEVFDHWQSLDALIKHKSFYSGAVMAVKARLIEGYTVAELCMAITSYAAKVEKGTAPGHNAWTLEDLMKGGKGRGKTGDGTYIDRMLDPHYEGIVSKGRVQAANDREMEKFMRRDFS